MAALAAATPRDYEGESIFNHLPVKSGVTVYQGGGDKDEQGAQSQLQAQLQAQLQLL